MECKALTCRFVYQRRLAEANPSAAHTASLANQGFSEEARRGALNAVGHSAAR